MRPKWRHFVSGNVSGTSDFVEALGERLMAIRELAHLGIEQAAARVGMEVERLASIEAGKVELEIPEAMALCKAYDVGLDFLSAVRKPPLYVQYEGKKGASPDPSRFKLV